MSETLPVIGAIAGLIGFAAGILWLIEAIARRIGGKQAAVLLLGVIPSILGACIAVLNRAHLQWWEFAVYPLAGPLLACGAVVLGYVAVSSFGIPDLLGLACKLVVRGVMALWRLLRRAIGALGGRDA
jgi:hypothetical protein